MICMAPSTKDLILMGGSRQYSQIYNNWNKPLNRLSIPHKKKRKKKDFEIILHYKSGPKASASEYLMR